MLLPETYRKLIAHRRSPHFREATSIVEVPMPRPGPGELLIRNRYAGVNATDVNITAGRYQPDLTPPFDLGVEAVGEVVAVGEGVQAFQPGDPVGTIKLGGGYAEYQLVPAKHAIPVPEVSPEVVSLLISGLTASIALQEVGRIRAGEKVLVTAAAGGTGQYAVQLARLAGCTVIGTCGTAEKAALLRELGCDRVINYREEDVGHVLRQEFPEGIDVIYESVGGELFDRCLEALARHGRLLCIGFISEYLTGPQPVAQPRIYARLIPRSASVHGFFLPHFVTHFRAHLPRLFQLYRTGKLRVAVDPTPFQGLESVPDAVEHLHAGRNVGKVVVCL
ncbi:MAG: quinone oxidoreductase family protein [Rhodothermus sp.]|nr:quinone oxidoreductase family protein [Rhodothermus sp.]